ncbi:hypothetical protein, partial [Corynebacterium falsenii]|uniref:hypothetical protein n=1 Tax=Corynebacterium falsenii TaxID=108486 RepID=UPI0030B82A4D
LFPCNLLSRPSQMARKHSKNIKIAGGVAAVSVLVGLTVANNAFFTIILPLLALGFMAYSGYKIKEIVNHKDQW